MAVLLDARRIWDRAPHCAFTDLARIGDAWYCVFREASGHQGCEGRIRVLRSADGAAWTSAALLRQRGIDLRDPKISRAPNRELQLLVGGTTMRGGAAAGRRPRVSVSRDGARWSRPVPALEEGDWLWRSTWFRGTSYGISYRLLSPRRWGVELFASADGRGYRRLWPLAVPGRPNEATLRFLRDGSAVALVRREGANRRAWIGTSRPPYRRWTWAETRERVGGPNFLALPGGMWAAARTWRHGEPVVSVCRMTRRSLVPVLDLPSGGDCGYPGMVFHRGLLWLSYYSSHEGRSSIYLAKVRLR